MDNPIFEINGNTLFYGRKGQPLIDSRSFRVNMTDIRFEITEEVGVPWMSHAWVIARRLMPLFVPEPCTELNPIRIGHIGNDTEKLYEIRLSGWSPWFGALQTIAQCSNNLDDHPAVDEVEGVIWINALYPSDMVIAIDDDFTMVTRLDRILRATPMALTFVKRELGSLFIPWRLYGSSVTADAAILHRLYLDTHFPPDSPGGHSEFFTTYSSGFDINYDVARGNGDITLVDTLAEFPVLFTQYVREASLTGGTFNDDNIKKYDLSWMEHDLGLRSELRRFIGNQLTFKYSN